MKIEKRMLSYMYDTALRNLRMDSKLPSDTSDQFVARCWINAFMTVIEMEGYNVTKNDYVTNNDKQSTSNSGNNKT